jgi:hypothetical protein
MNDAGLGTRFALASLATWRVAHLLVEEDGPGDVVVRVRAKLGASFAGELMDCFACTSVWVAAQLSLTVVRRRRDAPVAWLALSGAACLLERIGAERAQDDFGALDAHRAGDAQSGLMKITGSDNDS